jgi:hypothetical protein
MFRNTLLFGLSLFLLSSCVSHQPEDKTWQSLFNGEDLTGWDTYLGPRYDTLLKRWDTIPVGLNIDPDRVFSVVELNGQKVLRISGEHFGGISTRQEFENYHLQLQFKWGTLQWAPRKNGKKDSGLMYHGVGPQGADGGFWLRSQEFQIQQGDCGDYYACAGAITDIRVKMDQDSTYVYNKEGELVTFSDRSPAGRHVKKDKDAEKPAGEWNTLDLYCYGGTSVHVVNGEVVMVLHNSRQYDGDKEIPLTKGKIQIETEGAEVFYRDIKIRPIEAIPESLLDE